MARRRAGGRAGRRTRWGLVVALSGVLLGVLVPVASASGTTSRDLPGPYTGITVRTWPIPQTVFDPVPGTRAADDRDGPVTVTGARTATTESWTVTFTPRVGSPISLHLFGSRIGPGELGMDASVQTGGVQCISAVGATITEYHADPTSGRPDVLAVDLVGWCYQGHNADRMGMEAHLRLAASTPYGGLDIPLDRIDPGWPTIGVAGTPVSVPVRYVGNGSIGVGSPEVVPFPDRGVSALYRFPVDTCAGRTLTDGDTCEIDVQQRPLTGISFLPAFLLHGPDGTVIGAAAFAYQLDTPRTDPVGSVMEVTGRALDIRQSVGSTPARKVPVNGVVAVTVDRYTMSGPSIMGGGLAFLDLTAVAPAASGYLSVLPSATSPTTTSAVNFGVGRTTSNLVLAPVDATGHAYVRNVSSQPVDVIADLEGVTQPRAIPAGTPSPYSGRLHPVPPSRVLDTRTAAGGARPLPTGETVLGLRLPRFQYPSTAVLATVTVVSPTAPGWVRLGTTAGTSSVTFARGETTSNTVLAWMGGLQLNDDQLSVTVGGAPVHVIIDVVAVVDDSYSPSGIVITPTPGGPVRIADSRRGLGLTTLPAGTPRSLPVPSSLRDQDTWGVVQNLTAVPTRPAWLVAYPTGTSRPPTSSLLATVPGPRASTVLTGLSSGGSQDVYASAGPTDVLSDVSARVQLFPSTAQLGGFDRIPESLSAIPPATRSR